MDVSKITEIIAALPQAREIGDASYWSNVVPKVVDHVVDDIVTSWDFDFAIGEYSDDSTVSGTAAYVLRGANNDLRDIVSIRLGSSKKILDRYRPQDMDALLNANQEPTGVFGWYLSNRHGDGFPEVTLVNTPTTAEALYVRYRKNGLTLADIPDEFGHVVVRGVLGWMQPGLIGLYRDALRVMVERYKAGGRDVSLAPFNDHMMRTNKNIHTLYETP